MTTGTPRTGPAECLLLRGMINGSRVDLVVASYDDPIVTGLLAGRAADPAAAGDAGGGRGEGPRRRPEAAPGTVFLIARAGHEPVGCAGLRWPGADTAEVAGLFVRAGWRDAGVARLLLAGVEELARGRGCRVARLSAADLRDAGPGEPSGYVRVPPATPRAPGGYVRVPAAGPRSDPNACFEKALDTGGARPRGPRPDRGSARLADGHAGVQAP